MFFWFIRLIGPTGSGKSSVSLIFTPLQDTNIKIIQFLSKATGNGGDVGHTLTSCTTELKVAKCEEPTLSSIFLMDTPGFDGNLITDLEVSHLASEWLDKRWAPSPNLAH